MFERDQVGDENPSDDLSNELPPLSIEQQALPDERLEAMGRMPDEWLTWDEMRAQIEKKK